MADFVSSSVHELGALLPNGFHDAEISSYVIDVVTRIATIDMDVWVGNVDADERREVYRPARVTISGLHSFVVEPPDARYGADGAPLVVDLCDADESQRAYEGCFTARWFVAQWNAFILFDGKTAALTWTGEEHDRSSARAEANVAADRASRRT